MTSQKKRAIRQSNEYKNTKLLLEKLFTNILNLSDKRGWLPTPYETFEDNCADFNKKWVETVEVSNVLRGLKTNVHYPSPKHQAMSKMLAFMGLVESIGVTMADMLLILLIANGKAVHTQGKNVWHIHSFSELRKVDWSYKRDFLVKEGFEIIKGILNLEKRNNIAHLHYTVTDNGEIKQGNNTINIEHDIDAFWNAIDTLILLFEDLDFLKWLAENSEANLKLTLNADDT